MCRLGTEMQPWTLCFLLCGMFMGQVVSEPYYMVAIPAVLQAAAETRFCASLQQPSGNLTMTVTLISQRRKTILLEKTSDKEFHDCTQFVTPFVQNEEMQTFEVEVRGNAFYSKEARKVIIKAYQPTTFIQTDKPIYLPGQKVHFRVVTLDLQLRPASQQYNVIALVDPNSNRIQQWLNETSNSKILQLSYALSSEAREGQYRIEVKTGKQTAEQDFIVEKYVLPKFDVTLKLKNEVCILQEELDVEVCGKYTFGQPVPGSVTVRICRPLLPHFSGNYHYHIKNPEEHDIKGPCVIKTKKADMKGCTAFTVEMLAFTRIDSNVAENELYVSATVEEEGTGISRPEEKKIRISYIIGKLSFFDIPKIYQPQSNVEGKVKAVDYRGTPVPHLPLLVTGMPFSHSLQVVTDSNGVATFSFRTDSSWEVVPLHAESHAESSSSGKVPGFYKSDFHSLSASELPFPDTKTHSSLEVKRKDKPLSCGKEEDIIIRYTLERDPQGFVNVMYLVFSKGHITRQGITKVEVQDKSVNVGEVSIKLNVSGDMAPSFQVVAYAVLSNDHVIAHSADFSTELCFNNKVSLGFSPSSVVPGEETKLQLTAQPDSLCGVSAIDQSVLIRESGKVLNAKKIFDLHRDFRTALHLPYHLEDYSGCLNVRPKRQVQYYDHESGALHVFTNVGLKMATNLILRKPSCLRFRGEEYHRGAYGFGMAGGAPQRPVQMGIGAGGMALMEGMGGLSDPVAYLLLCYFPPLPVGYAPLSPLEPAKTVRMLFPETWIWDLVEIGESGTKNVSFTAPDTITTWETETFCLSPQGFGLAPRQKLTVFQPFFLELTLPYSIIRGENFELKATVFNYLTSCILMKVTPAPSSDFTLSPLSGDQYTSCLCGNERKTLSWTMTPTALGVVNVTVTAEAVPSHASCDNEIVSVPERGRVDVVTRSLIVKAEGAEVAKTHNWLLCPKGGALTEKTEIHLPENVVDGSVRATVSVLGDILGRALKNLDDLLQMPYGCGEQNMALLAPNIYILHYLKNTHQLTPAINEKAFNFLTSGYQRQLNYKDNAGAYSTFGSGPGNTWLTTFVLKSFFKAQSFVFIEPTKIEESRTWLVQQQQPNGCFRQSGKLFNNRMKGGISDEVTLSAYITAAFLEMNMSTSSPVLRRSLVCLKRSVSSFNNTYTTALLAYVFALAGDTTTSSHLLKHLDSVAVKQGGFTHWSQTASETSASLSVEISSYVLMAKLSSSHTTEDLGYASSIVRWLTSQQNHCGGFSSTQDTVVALQALALYATVVFSPEGSSTVTVQSASGQLTFDLNQENKLLYQEEMLQDVTGKYSVEVKGTACASVQIFHHYNIPTPTNVTTLSVKVEPLVNCISQSHKDRLTLQLNSLYSGKESSTNMVILDIKILTGFVPDSESLKRLKGAVLVDRVDHKDDHVVMYLQELRSGLTANHSIELIQELPVQNLKPAVVKIYDYYQPSDQAEAEYLYPCATTNIQ